MKKNINGDVIVGTAIVVFGLLFLIPAFSLGFKAPNGMAGPGAGFFPAITSGLTILFGGIVVLKAFKNPIVFFGSDKEQLANFKVIGLSAAAFAAFLLLWLFVDFFVGAGVLIFCLNLILRRPLKFNLIFTAAALILIYLIFAYLLDIQFAL